MRSDYPTEKTHPIDSVATSEMSSGLKTGSIVALIASVIGPLWASLALNPVSNVTASQTSTVEETAPVEVVETPIEPDTPLPQPRR
ncbi:MAG: hypothetical protein HC825_00325 [Oscillatoriales cyanobacterium RM1_1_9]|nr:hypothetical protein [Oscillatoriales cyanobacterium RM1_1_9]